MSGIETVASGWLRVGGVGRVSDEGRRVASDEFRQLQAMSFATAKR